MVKKNLLLLIILISSTIIWAHDDNEDPDHHDVIDVSHVVVPENITYYEHVKPIIELNCVACHSEGQIAGDISFTELQEVLNGAEDIAYNVSIGYMPPWMPSDLTPPLKHDRSLSDLEIATLIAWVEQGMAAGDEADYTPPQAIAYQLENIRPDLILQSEKAYTPDANKLDDYRCFAFPLDITEPQFLTGYEFMPDVTEMAHHGIVYLVGNNAEGAIERKNYEDGKPGWSCYGSPGLNSLSTMIGTWAPGTLPVSYPKGTGYLIEPGDYLVIQMHYNLVITRLPDLTSVALQFAEDNTDIQELITAEVSAPVEIPCPTGIEGPQCERANAINRVAELYGSDYRLYADGLLRACRQTLALYENNTGENASTFCQFPVPAPLTIYGAFGHMHELGSSFRFELNPDRDDSMIILDLPRWDFHWQDRYQFVEPIQVDVGDVLRMTCTWDNRLSSDPRYVVWGEGTADEMCFGTIIITSP